MRRGFEFCVKWLAVGAIVAWVLTAAYFCCNGITLAF
jgi:hypothetical protein